MCEAFSFCTGAVPQSEMLESEDLGIGKAVTDGGDVVTPETWSCSRVLVRMKTKV